MESDLIADLLKESQLSKNVAIMSLICSFFNLAGFFWLFHLVNK